MTVSLQVWFRIKMDSHLAGSNTGNSGGGGGGGGGGVAVVVVGL
jgi:hypothetical protein